jgi:hypothetical protein
VTFIKSLSRAVSVAAIVAVATIGVAWANAPASQPSTPIIDVVERDRAAMFAAQPDSELTLQLRRDVESLKRDIGTPARPDPLYPQAPPAGPARRESGVTACEPYPGLLSVAELVGARCVLAPQPDGSTRFVVIAPDGVVRTVALAKAVRRLPDVRIAGLGDLGRATFTVAPDGSVVVNGQTRLAADEHAP